MVGDVYKEHRFKIRCIHCVSVRRIVLIVVGGIVVMICQGLRRWLFTSLLVVVANE